MKLVRNSILLLLILCSAAAQAQQILRLSLRETIAMANDSSLSAFRYQNMYLSGYWEYRSYKAERLPSLTLNMTPAQYYRYITQRYDSQQDIDVYREQQMLSASAGLSLAQNFDLLGGTFYVDTQLDYMRNFGASNYTQYSTVPFRIGYQQSLLGYNAFRWDRKIEPLKFEKVKKQYLYHAESVSEEAVDYFFSLAMAQADYKLALDNVATTDTLYAIGEQRQKIASISQADLLTLKLDRVNARNTLKNAEIARKRAMSALATFLNMDRNSYIEIDLPARPHIIDIPADRAMALARENNPTYLEQGQNVLEAEREVDRTKKESRFNASFNASVGFNQVADNFSGAYRKPMQQDLVSLTVSIPLIDWGVRKGKYNMAKNNLNVAKISARQEEVSLEEDVMMTASDFSVQQDMIASAEEALDLAELAYDQTRKRFIIGKADINSLTLALNRQQEAQKNYIQAMQNYWLNYYKIRKLTLYDFESGISLSDRFDFDNLLK
jgi:outer membrane protein TolC